MTNENSNTETTKAQFLKELAELLGKYNAGICSENYGRAELYVNNECVFEDVEISQKKIEEKTTQKKNWLVFLFNEYFPTFDITRPAKTVTVEDSTMLEAEYIAFAEIGANRKLVDYRIVENSLELYLAAIKTK